MNIFVFRRFLFLVSLCCLFPSNNALAVPIEWNVSDGGNGHLYEAFSVSGGVTWTDANSAVQSLGDGWHLATITSAEENAFIFDMVKDDPSFWYCCTGGNASGPWLGGIKVGPAVGDYEWITGEAFSYQNWAPLEPFGNGERIALFGFHTTIGSQWNDIGPNRLDVVSYVAEKSTFSVPEPSTMALLLGGLIFGLSNRKRKKLF